MFIILFKCNTINFNKRENRMLKIYPKSPLEKFLPVPLTFIHITPTFFKVHFLFVLQVYKSLSNVGVSGCQCWNHEARKGYKEYSINECDCQWNKSRMSFWSWVRGPKWLSHISQLQNAGHCSGVSQAVWVLLDILVSFHLAAKKLWLSLSNVNWVRTMHSAQW